MMDIWIEVKEKNITDLNEFLINLNSVSHIFVDYDYDMWSVVFITNDGAEFTKSCKSELEAQMIYAKLKKLLCTNEELNEIL